MQSLLINFDNKTTQTQINVKKWSTYSSKFLEVCAAMVMILNVEILPSTHCEVTAIGLSVRLYLHIGMRLEEYRFSSIIMQIKSSLA